MCPDAVRLWFNMRVQKLNETVTVAAALSFTAQRNAERVGFLIASGGGSISYRPTSWGIAVNAGIYTPSAANPIPDLTIAHYGQLILEPWDFTFNTFPNTYQVWEIITPAVWK